MLNIVFALSEILITSFFFIFLVLIGVVVWRSWFGKSIDFRLFLVILIVKLLAALSYGAVYSFIYKDGGDTFVYWKNATKFWDLMDDQEYTQSQRYMRAESMDKANLPDIIIEGYTPRQADSFFLIRISAMLALITFSSYWSTSMVLSFFTFLGLLYLFKALTFRRKTKSYLYVLALFFIPSVLFFGSGLMKDTLIVGAFAFLIASLYFILNHGYRIYLNGLIALFMLWLIFKLRAFMFLLLLPLLTIWIALVLLKKIKSTRLRRNTRIFTFAALSLFFMLAFYIIQIRIPEFTLDNMWDTALGFQRWHEFQANMNETGSGYTLTPLEFSFIGISRAFVESLTVALFRPFFWEANNSLSFLAAIESFLMLIAVVFLTIKIGFVNIVKYIFESPFLFFLFLFSIIFLALTGFISYNFGALLRYKIPGTMTFTLGLACLYMYHSLSAQKT